MTLGRIITTSALAVAACGGEANLGGDGEAWGNPSDANRTTPGEITTLYRGERKVQAFTVDGGTLYVLLTSRFDVEATVELIACPVDDCADERRTLWRTSHPYPSYGTMVVEPPEVFWVDTYAQLVLGCTIDDCQRGPRALGSIGWSSQIAADADFVYWLDERQSLVRCPHAGCVTDGPPDANTLGVPGGPTGDQLVAHRDSIYARYDGGRSIVRWEKAGGDAREVVYHSVLPLSFFDVGEDGVHFATDVLTGEVKRCPLAGACGVGEVLAAEQRWPSVVKVAAIAVLWVSAVPDDAAFVRLAPSGEPVRVAPQEGNLGSVVVSEGHLYWSEALDNVDQIRRVTL
jgi:hypothetical protein